MQNVRRDLILGGAVVLIGAASFLDGRMFNTGLGPRSESGIQADGQVFVSMNDITPAADLPQVEPEITGFFVEQKDNTVIVQAVSFDAGVSGIAEHANQDANSGPRVEVIITGKTVVYRETTELNRPVAGEGYSIQQSVEESMLDDLNTQTMITVWGSRREDRVIADVLVYLNPLLINKP